MEGHPLPRAYRPDARTPQLGLPAKGVLRIFKTCLVRNMEHVCLPAAIDLLEVAPERVWYELLVGAFLSGAAFVNPSLPIAVWRCMVLWRETAGPRGAPPNKTALSMLGEAVRMVCRAGKWPLVRLSALYIGDVETGEVHEDIWGSQLADPADREAVDRCLRGDRRRVVRALATTLYDRVGGLTAYAWAAEYIALTCAMLLCLYGRAEVVWNLLEALAERRAAYRAMAPLVADYRQVWQSLALPSLGEHHGFPMRRAWGRERAVLQTVLMLMCRAAAVDPASLDPAEARQHTPAVMSYEAFREAVGDVRMDSDWFLDVRSHFSSWAHLTPFELHALGGPAWDPPALEEAEARARWQRYASADPTQYLPLGPLVSKHRYPVPPGKQAHVYFDLLGGPPCAPGEPNEPATHAGHAAWVALLAPRSDVLHKRGAGAFSLRAILASEASLSLTEDPQPPAPGLACSAPLPGSMRGVHERFMGSPRVREHDRPAWMAPILFVHRCRLPPPGGVVNVFGQAEPEEYRVYLNPRSYALIVRSQALPPWVGQETPWIAQRVPSGAEAQRFLVENQVRALLDPQQVALAHWEARVYDLSRGTLGRGAARDPVVFLAHRRMGADLAEAADILALLRAAPLHVLADLLACYMLWARGVRTLSYLLVRDLAQQPPVLAMPDADTNVVLLPRNLRSSVHSNPEPTRRAVRDFFADPRVRIAASDLCRAWEQNLEAAAPSCAAQGLARPVARCFQFLRGAAARWESPAAWRAFVEHLVGKIL